MPQRRFWHQIYYGAAAGVHPINWDLGARNVMIEGFTAYNVSGVADQYIHLDAHLLNGKDVHLIPSNPDGTNAETTMRLPTLANWLNHRQEYITEPIELCQLDYLVFVWNNNTGGADNWGGYIRGWLVE